MATTNRVEIDSAHTSAAAVLEHTIGDDLATLSTSRGQRVVLDESRLRELKAAVDAALDDVTDVNLALAPGAGEIDGQGHVGLEDTEAAGADEGEAR